MHNSLFIASTGQHVGKTTICLGLLAGIQKRLSKVGFMKPIGQEHIEVDQEIKVDKDVVLFKKTFNIPDAYPLMSPIIFSRDFTRRFLDGQIDKKFLEIRILDAYKQLVSNHPLLLVEGTGHVGVGSIVGLSNAAVARLMGTKMILIASGGLGSTFDALALNKQLCDAHGIEIAGVILNRVLPDKRDMVVHYMTKALSQWGIPLLGAVPYDPLLSSPCMNDFEMLFGTKLITGEKHRFRHYKHTRLVASSAEIYRHAIKPSQLIITPTCREDIILATISKYWDVKLASPDHDLEPGLILTGNIPPKEEMVRLLNEANIPMLHAQISSFEAMQMITSHTAKIRTEDTEKVKEAIRIVEAYVDFDTLIKLACPQPEGSATRPKML